jgi:hypothetical protein
MACEYESKRKYYEANLEQGREYYVANKEERHASGFRCRIKRKYGLTLERYNQLLESQGNRCGACKRKLGKGITRPAIDHCHATGVVRGILCHRCNLGEGLFETPENVLRLYRYMTKNELFYAAK